MANRLALASFLAAGALVGALRRRRVRQRQPRGADREDDGASSLWDGSLAGSRAALDPSHAAAGYSPSLAAVSEVSVSVGGGRRVRSKAQPRRDARFAAAERARSARNRTADGLVALFYALVTLALFAAAAKHTLDVHWASIQGAWAAFWAAPRPRALHDAASQALAWLASATTRVRTLTGPALGQAWALVRGPSAAAALAPALRWGRAHLAVPAAAIAAPVGRAVYDFWSALEVFFDSLSPGAAALAGVLSATVLAVSLAVLASLAGARAAGGGGGGGREGWAQRRVASLRVLHPPGSAEGRRALCGTWLRDVGLSSLNDKVADAMQLNWLMRSALTLVRGMDVDIHETSDRGNNNGSNNNNHPVSSSAYVELSVFSALPFYRSRERYPLSGAWAGQRRRDWRGDMEGSLAVMGDAVQIVTRWGPPHEGGSRDVFTLLTPNDILCDATVVVDGRVFAFQTLFRRKGAPQTPAALLERLIADRRRGQGHGRANGGAGVGHAGSVGQVHGQRGQGAVVGAGQGRGGEGEGGGEGWWGGERWERGGGSGAGGWGWEAGRGVRGTGAGLCVSPKHAFKSKLLLSSNTMLCTCANTWPGLAGSCVP